MKSINLEIPEELLRYLGDDPHRKIKYLIVIGLYQEGKLTLNQVADILDLNYKETRELLAAKNILVEFDKKILEEELIYDLGGNNTIADRKMLKLRVDLPMLCLAFEDGSGMQKYYLDCQTGEVIVSSSEAEFSDDFDSIEEMKDAIECNPTRYIRVPNILSREGYENMEEFIETLEDPNLKEKLYIAIDGPGAFRRFKDVLIAYPEERENWFTFRDKKIENRVIEWLKSIRIEIIT